MFADDAHLAARVSCALAKPGYYLPVVEGPRMSRPDPGEEVVRRLNVAGRSKAASIFLVGLLDASFDPSHWCSPTTPILLHAYHARWPSRAIICQLSRGRE